MEPFIGEIRMFGGNYAPRDWALCDGRTLDIASHDVLFSLLGTTYGGDGTTTFALPDLRGRVPIHPNASDGQPIGQKAGVEGVTLTPDQFPPHSHAFAVVEDIGGSSDPAGNVLGTVDGLRIYRAADANVAMHAGSIGDSRDPTGQPYGSATPRPHQNMQPFVCVNFIIALAGIFPPRS
ncbi:MAG: phage tail protein [Gemmatimonadota bacterium]